MSIFGEIPTRKEMRAHALQILGEHLLPPLAEIVADYNVDTIDLSKRIDFPKSDDAETISRIIEAISPIIKRLTHDLDMAKLRLGHRIETEEAMAQFWFKTLSQLTWPQYQKINGDPRMQGKSSFHSCSQFERIERQASKITLQNPLLEPLIQHFQNYINVCDSGTSREEAYSVTGLLSRFYSNGKNLPCDFSTPFIQFLARDTLAETRFNTLNSYTLIGREIAKNWNFLFTALLKSGRSLTVSPDMLRRCRNNLLSIL